MANPAQLLHEMLSRWRPHNGNVNPTEQRIAVRHLDSIADLLTQMEAVEIKTVLYRRYFDKWVELTLHHPHDWQTQNSLKHFDDSALENLEHLADRLESFLPTLQAGGLDAVRSYADGIRKLIDEDDSLDPHLKIHVKQVVAHLIWCVDNYDAVGDFDLGEAIERLLAAMVTAARVSRHRDRWKDALNKVVWPFVAAAAAAPIQPLVQFALGS